jgi:DNA-binding NarL/FixJ family response regulator
VVHAQSDREALIGTLVTLRPDVLLLDCSLPRLRRAEDIAMIQHASPGTAVLLLAQMPDESQAMSALKAAARGYCSVRIRPKLLRRAIQKIQGGEIWAGREVLSRLVAELALLVGRQRPAATGCTFAVLTPREWEIAGMVTEGAINKEIAARLNVREGTVKARLAKIFRKLGCSNRVQLALVVGGKAGPAPAKAAGSRSSARGSHGIMRA